jgi:hypothetical protein
VDGPRAFQYYVRAALNHLRSEAAAGDEAAMLLSVIEFRLEHESESLVPVLDELTAFCQHVIDQWPRWKEDTEPVYGDLLPRFINLREALHRSK